MKAEQIWVLQKLKQITGINSSEIENARTPWHSKKQTTEIKKQRQIIRKNFFSFSNEYTVALLTQK